MDTVQVMATVIIILVNGVISVVTARFIRLPLTLCILIWGMVSAILVPISGFDTGIRAENFQTLIMYVLIPILVFEAALNIKISVLKPLIATILFASTVGVIVSTLIAAVIIYYAIGHPSGFPWVAALLAALVISATDPVAVVDQLKVAKAPESLATVIEGESLFNDASAIVLFGILLAMALGQSEASLTASLYQLFWVLTGGVLVGLLSAAVLKMVLKLVPVNGTYFVLTSLSAAYGSFYLSEHLLHVSGVVAVLCCALFSKEALFEHKECHSQLHESWLFFGFLGNLIVFYLMGLVVTFDMFTDQWLAMLIGLLGAFLSRLISSYFSIGIGKWVFRNPLEWGYAPVMIWGGLRGVITLALVLSLPVELEYWWTIQSIGFGVVLFTLVVQATTSPLLLKKLGYQKL